MNASEDPVIPFRVSHAETIALTSYKVDALVKLAWAGLAAMSSIGLAILVALIQVRP